MILKSHSEVFKTIAAQDATDYIRKEDARGRFVPSSLNCIVLILRLLCMHLQLRMRES